MRIRFDLAADVLDVCVDGAFVGLDCHAVHCVEQLRTGEDATGLARHTEQKLELRRRQLDAPAVNRCHHARDVQLDTLADLDHVTLQAASFGASQHRTHPRHHLTWAEGLGDVVVRPQLQPGDAVRLLGEVCR